jgi:hypothetical protein
MVAVVDLTEAFSCDIARIRMGGPGISLYHETGFSLEKI